MHTLNQIMRKEILLAIIVGVVFGLGATFGIYTVRQSLFRNTTPEAIEASKLGVQSSPTPTPNNRLNISNPAQDLFTQEKSTRIVGRALADSLIVVLAENDEFITTADKDGDFSVEVELIEGGNLLTVVATAPDGSQDSTTLNIVSTTLSNEATPGASTR